MTNHHKTTADKLLSQRQAEADRHSSGGRPQSVGSMYESCYDCHENWAPSGYRCNQSVATEHGVNQIVLVQSYQKCSGLFCNEMRGRGRSETAVIFKNTPSYTSLALKFDLISIKIDCSNCFFHPLGCRVRSHRHPTQEVL